MVAIIYKSDLELNTLIAEHCDGYVWVTWDGMKGAPPQRRLKKNVVSRKYYRPADMTEEIAWDLNRLLPKYTTSFDEIYRVLRAQDLSDGMFFEELEEVTTLTDLAGWLVLKASPLDLCIALLKSLELGEE